MWDFFFYLGFPPLLGFTLVGEAQIIWRPPWAKLNVGCWAGLGWTIIHSELWAIHQGLLPFSIISCLSFYYMFSKKIYIFFLELDYSCTDIVFFFNQT
jgi:hypothetical protein